MLHTRAELKKMNIKPIKHKGQNFLISEPMISKIAQAADIKPGETVLEIGPGTGTLTQALLATGAKVIAVEKDKTLIQLLSSKFQAPSSKNKPTITNEDILEFDETTIKPPYKIVANIPYYLTGQLIQKFLMSPNKPKELILMVQKEVGERITSRPPKANYLSSLVGFLAEAEILFRVPKENFWPRPKVDSAVIRITPRRGRPAASPQEFVRFIRSAFKQPRQTLYNNLRKAGKISTDTLDSVFAKLELDKKIRPQNLNQEQLAELFAKIT